MNRLKNRPSQYNRKKEKLEIRALKWQSGYRRFIVPFISILVSFITAWYGFVKPSQDQIKNEQYQQLLEFLNSPYPELQLEAVDRLRNFGERAYFPLRLSLVRSKNTQIQQAILKVLPEDFGIQDKVEEVQFKEIVKGIYIKEQWIYVGNYNYQHNKWTDQTIELGYKFTLRNIENLTPNDLIGKKFIADVSINIRTSSPYIEGNAAWFGPKVGILNKGTTVEIIEIDEFPHINPYEKRIWAMIK